MSQLIGMRQIDREKEKDFYKSKRMTFMRAREIFLGVEEKNFYESKKNIFRNGRKTKLENISFVGVSERESA